MSSSLVPQSLALDAWSWTESIRFMIGPAVAAVFVVIGIWLKEVYERKRTAQLWYEGYYITEGLDPFIAHILTLELLLLDFRFSDVRPELVRLDLTVGSRVLTLLGSRRIVAAAYFLESAVEVIKPKEKLTPEDHKKLDPRIDHAQALNDLLGDLRKILLKITITNKAAIYEIRNRSDVARLIASIEQSTLTAAREAGMKIWD